MTKNKYLYSFFVWVAPYTTWSKAYIDTLQQLNHNARLEMDFTEDEFAQYRLDLKRDGLELKEVSRVPYAEPEIVL